MIIIRAFFATLSFSFSTYLVFDLFANGFNWMVLIISIVGYIAAHYLWPKDHAFDSAIFDFLEIIVELPFRTMALAIRSIFRIFKSGDADIGVDL